MKSLIRRALARFGYSLRHLDPHPVIAALDRDREKLRLTPDRPEVWMHTLSQLALSAHLCEAIRLHRPDLVIDVGANRGQFALQLRELGYAGPIVSIEPQRVHAAALQAVAARSGTDWAVLHGAAGDTSGELTLHTFADDTFSSFHTPSSAAHERFGALLRPRTSEVVAVRPLTQWLRDTAHASATRIFLKTDTQGHDLPVLRGADLTNVCLVLAEGSFVPLYDSAATPSELAAVLAPSGLRPAGYYAVSYDVKDLAALELDCLFSRPPR